MGIEGAVGHLLQVPVLHAYAALWRLGLLAVGAGGAKRTRLSRPRHHPR